MMRVALVNPPFADFNRPPIGLAQLRSVLQSSLSGSVETTIVHLNLDFARCLGLPAYAIIANTVDAMLAGTGDWLFRAAAFPEVPDNETAYFRRFPRTFGTHQKKMFDLLVAFRPKVPQVLNELIDHYQLDQFDLVGFTSTFQQNLACLATSRRLKERRPEIITAMGGANCEAPMGQTLASLAKHIDFVFSGPALKTFPKLVGFLAAGDREKCHDISGVFSKKRLPGPTEREIGEELDINVNVPVDYDDYFAALDEKLADTQITPHLLFETSRGCWWGQRAHCTFCGLNGVSMAYRALKPEGALAQFEKLFEYAPRVMRFESVDNIMPKEYLTQVFPHLRSPKEIFYEVKADLSDEDLGVMAKAGVGSVQPGIEALATPTLKLMKKGTTASGNVRFLKNCACRNINPVWNLLVGFPGEQEETYRKYCQDIPLLVHLPPPSGVHPVRFDRFSPYYDLATEYGLRLKPYPFYEFVYPFDESALANLAYYFYNEDFDAPYFQTLVQWLPVVGKKVADWRARWYQAGSEPRPELYIERQTDGLIVHDSRSGKPTQVELDEVASRILERLMTPAALSRLKSEQLGLDPQELERQVTLLEGYGFIFRDGERLLSLPTTSRTDGYVIRSWPTEALIAAFEKVPT